MTFLIVEDERDVCLALAMRVSDLELDLRKKVLTAFSAEEALGILSTNRIDCLITDIKLTGMNGLELIAEAVKFQPLIKSIVVTAYDDFNYARQAIRLGCSDFLLKPFDRATLREAILRTLKTDDYAKRLESENAKGIDWLITYARSHPCEAIDMNFIMQNLHMNYSYFTRLFKEHTGSTFTAFMQELRMDEACRLLVSGMTVTEVAERLGYVNTNNFSRAFSSVFGKSPTSWLKEMNVKD